MSGTVERLWEAIEPFVAEEGIELDDLEVVGSGHASIVRVTIDAGDGSGSVDVDRIARISRSVSRMLDEDDPVSGSYTLEVTSPGLERKLRRPRHYEKSIGRAVKVKTMQPVDEATNHRGTLVASDDKGFVLEVDGEERSIAFDDVVSARTVFVWEKNPKPGKRQ